MGKRPVGLGLTMNSGVPFAEQLELMKQIGYDSFFVVLRKELDLQSLMDKAQQLGLRCSSLHAPWDHAADMWHEKDSLAERGIEQLCGCVDACARWQIPILVVHAYVGFEPKPVPSEGIARYAQVVAYAREKGVRIAFENTEGEEFLFALMGYFAGDPTVGFCWDTGHEMCYNRSQDLLSRFGDRLIYTHLNDNLGISDPDGRITWLDDLHLLPFDGVADWQDITRRLRKWDYRGALTFEMNLVSKPGRTENDGYKQIPYEAYLKALYERACKIREMLNTQENT